MWPLGKAGSALQQWVYTCGMRVWAPWGRVAGRVVKIWYGAVRSGEPLALMLLARNTLLALRADYDDC